MLNSRVTLQQVPTWLRLCRTRQGKRGKRLNYKTIIFFSLSSFIIALISFKLTLSFFRRAPYRNGVNIELKGLSAYIKELL